MASINDILQADVFFRQGSNEAMIVQFFKVTAISSSDETEVDVAYTIQEILGKILWPMWGHTSAEYYKTRVKNVTDNLGYAEALEDVAGAIGNNAMPRYDSISIRQSVPTLLTRGGFKRLPFGSESQNDAGTWVIGAPELEDILNFFQDQTLVLDADDPHEPTGTIIHPVIVGRTLNSAIPPVYELDLDKVQLVSAATPRGWTTQNTRK